MRIRHPMWRNGQLSKRREKTVEREASSFVELICSFRRLSSESSSSDPEAYFGAREDTWPHQGLGESVK